AQRGAARRPGAAGGRGARRPGPTAHARIRAACRRPAVRERQRRRRRRAAAPPQPRRKEVAMFVIIAGGGRTGSHLAALLLSQNHTVHLLEARPETLVSLHRELPTETIFEGDPTDPGALAAAGIEHAHVVAAVTSSDPDNLIIASLARFQYNVGRVIGRVNNPRNAWLFTPDFGVDVALNQADI